MFLVNHFGNLGVLAIIVTIYGAKKLLITNNGELWEL